MPKVRVQRRERETTCPLCLEQLSEDAFECGCGVRYHAACVSELGGKCVPGCERELGVGARHLSQGEFHKRLDLGEAWIPQNLVLWLEQLALQRLDEATDIERAVGGAVVGAVLGALVAGGVVGWWGEPALKLMGALLAVGGGVGALVGWLARRNDPPKA